MGAIHTHFLWVKSVQKLFDLTLNILETYICLICEYMGRVTVINSEKEIGKQSSRSVLVSYIHFCTNNLKKGMNSILLLTAMG